MSNIAENLIKILERNKVNPWAVCHKSTGPGTGDKFERCVKKVKGKTGYHENKVVSELTDRIIKRLNEEPEGSEEGLGPIFNKLHLQFKTAGQGKAGRKKVRRQLRGAARPQTPPSPARNSRTSIPSSKP